MLSLRLGSFPYFRAFFKKGYAVVFVPLIYSKSKNKVLPSVNPWEQTALGMAVFVLFG